MEKMNKITTQIFQRLIEKLNDKYYVEFLSDELRPLSIARLERVKKPLGKGMRYSLVHTFILNEFLVRDAEMCFIVVDDRKNPTDDDGMAIYPESYQHGPLGVHEEWNN